MTKRELMHQFDDWVTDPHLKLDTLRRFVADPNNIGQPHLGRYLIWESSGSSGEPGVFVQDESSVAVNDALEALRRPALQPLRRWRDPWYAAEKMAFVGPTTGHFASTVSVRRLCRINPWVASHLRSFSFLEPAANLVAQLNAHKPTVLITYPTAALMLAEQALAGQLRISLKEIWTGGENLSSAMRGFVSASFKCPVAQSYGASEFLSIASECRCGQLHVNSDWAILESVDEQRRPVPDGQAGCMTLLTNLANRVQPIVRYELGDCIRVHAKPCPCGSAFPAIDVQGRVDDSMVLLDANGAAVRLLPLALTTVLEEDAGLFDFQLRQTGDRSLQLDIMMGGVDGKEMLVRARNALMRHLKIHGLSGVALRIRYGQPRPCGCGGKTPRVVASRQASSKNAATPTDACEVSQVSQRGAHEVA